MQWWVLLSVQLTQGLTELLLLFFVEVLAQPFTQLLQSMASVSKLTRLSKMWKLKYFEVWATFPLEFLRYSFAVDATVITGVRISVFG